MLFRLCVYMQLRMLPDLASEQLQFLNAYCPGHKNGGELLIELWICIALTNWFLWTGSARKGYICVQLKVSVHPYN